MSRNKISSIGSSDSLVPSVSRKYWQSLNENIIKIATVHAPSPIISAWFCLTKLAPGVCQVSTCLSGHILVKKYMGGCVCVCVHGCVHSSVCVCVRACVRACMRACVHASAQLSESDHLTLLKPASDYKLLRRFRLSRRCCGSCRDFRLTPGMLRLADHLERTCSD